jgi:glycosyltransferase involved in cell wall biosynthesis
MKMEKSFYSNVPILTIGIITYNRSGYLLKMLDSIPKNNPNLMNQIEILILNNGSTDNTVSLLQDYSQRLEFKYLEQKVNIRGAETFEKIINHATGKFMIIPGDDDCFYMDAISQLVERLNFLEDDVNLLTCFADVIDEKDHLLSSNYRPSPNDTQEKVLAKLIFDSIFWLPSTVFRREILQNLNLSQSLIALDWSFWIEAITKGKYLVFQTPIIKYRQHSNREQESYLKQTWDLDSFLMLESSISFGSLREWFDKTSTNSLDLFVKEFYTQSKNKSFSNLQIAIYLLVCKVLQKKTNIQSLIFNLYENPNIKLDPRFMQTLFGINLTLPEIDIIFRSIGLDFSYSGNNFKKHGKLNFFKLLENNELYSYEWKIGTQFGQKKDVSLIESINECLHVYDLLQRLTRKLEIESTITPFEKKILNLVRSIRKLKYGRRRIKIQHRRRK